jgi:glucan phosphoethanolaminetransferase (alkaline phosphatase superfamily)
MNENFELEDMRQQMNTLKKKLDQQQIVNDHIIRQSMKKTANSIKTRYYAIMALSLLMIPYTYVILIERLGISFAFWIATAVFMLVCCGATYYNSLNVNIPNAMGRNLIEVSNRMARAKKFDANWLFFGIPAVIAWLAWLTWESYQQDAESAHYMFYGTVCGAIIGSILGFSLHHKTQGQYQEIIDAIEEITAEEDA